MIRKYLTFLAAFLAAAAALRAQENNTTSVETLEGVVVTATRLPAFLGQSARMVTVLDSVAISSIPASNINDLLKSAVGVDVRQRGAEAVQTDISLRGGTCEQVAILLDGISISDPQTGHNSAGADRDPGRSGGPDVWNRFPARGHQYRDPETRKQGS